MGISEQDYQKAVAVVMDCSSGSVSNLQRKLYWGYARAAAAIDRMQEEFIVSPMHPSGRRDVYPSDIHQLWKDLNAAKTQAVPEGFVLVPEDQFESLNEFKGLYKRAIINAKKRKNQINWAHVAELGVGSGRAVDLCKSLGIDPGATNMHVVIEAREQSHENG